MKNHEIREESTGNVNILEWYIFAVVNKPGKPLENHCETIGKEHPLGTDKAMSP